MSSAPLCRREVLLCLGWAMPCAAGGWGGGTSQAQGSQDFVRLGELQQQGKGVRIPTMAFWRKLFSYLPSLTSPHCWDCGCNKLPQIPSLTQPLMLARADSVARARLSLGSEARLECWCASARIGGLGFQSSIICMAMHTVFPFHNRGLESETVYLPDSKQATFLWIMSHKHKHRIPSLLIYTFFPVCW